MGGASDRKARSYNQMRGRKAAGKYASAGNQDIEITTWGKMTRSVFSILPKDDLPSVTQVLSVYQDFSAIPPGVLSNAAERGTVVHRLCAAIASGLPQMAAPPADSWGFVFSFQTWFESVVSEVIAVEAEFIDHENGFVGHPDLICRIRGDSRLTIVDYKTPATSSMVWRGQMAAYRRLAHVAGFDIGRQFTLRLDRDGRRPKVGEYTDSARDLAAFLAALTSYRYFKTPTQNRKGK